MSSKKTSSLCATTTSASCATSTRVGTTSRARHGQALRARARARLEAQSKRARLISTNYVKSTISPLISTIIDCFLLCARYGMQLALENDGSGCERCESRQNGTSLTHRALKRTRRVVTSCKWWPHSTSPLPYLT